MQVHFKVKMKILPKNTRFHEVDKHGGKVLESWVKSLIDQ